MLFIWTGHHPREEISGEITRKKEEAKDMAHRKLTTQEMLKGVRAAIRSRRTPPQLKASLKRRAVELQEMIHAANRQFESGVANSQR
jgi:hypothetical protein